MEWATASATAQFRRASVLSSGARPAAAGRTLPGHRLTMPYHTPRDTSRAAAACRDCGAVRMQQLLVGVGGSGICQQKSAARCQTATAELARCAGSSTWNSCPRA